MGAEGLNIQLNFFIHTPFTKTQKMKKLPFLFLALCFFISCDQKATDPGSKKIEELNIDALKNSPDNFRLLFENDHVRVLEYTLKPGTKDRTHTHPPKSSYVVSGGKLKVHLENGDSLVFDEKPGSVAWMDYVGKHYVENIDTSEIKIIITEVKPSIK